MKKLELNLTKEPLFPLFGGILDHFWLDSDLDLMMDFALPIN